jgi:hypothetical protein
MVTIPNYNCCQTADEGIDLLTLEIGVAVEEYLELTARARVCSFSEICSQLQV